MKQKESIGQLLHNRRVNVCLFCFSKAPPGQQKHPVKSILPFRKHRSQERRRILHAAREQEQAIFPERIAPQVWADLLPERCKGQLGKPASLLVVLKDGIRLEFVSRNGIQDSFI